MVTSVNTIKGVVQNLDQVFPENLIENLKLLFIVVFKAPKDLTQVTKVFKVQETNDEEMCKDIHTVFALANVTTLTRIDALKTSI